MFKLFAALFGIGLVGMLGCVLLVAIPILIIALIIKAIFFK